MLFVLAILIFLPLQHRVTIFNHFYLPFTHNLVKFNSFLISLSSPAQLQAYRLPNTSTWKVLKLKWQLIFHHSNAFPIKYQGLNPMDTFQSLNYFISLLSLLQLVPPPLTTMTTITTTTITTTTTTTTTTNNDDNYYYYHYYNYQQLLLPLL